MQAMTSVRAFWLLFLPFLVAPARSPAQVTGTEETAAAGEEKPSEEGFTRFVKSEGLSGRYETAIATYVNDQGQSVDLVAAVHIADAGYYAALNEKFKGYDQLLYELVSSKNAKVDPKAKDSSLLSKIQRGMKSVLELEFQLDGIDYDAPNFVHADLTVEEFQQMMFERGETIFTMMIKMMAESAKAAREKPGAEPPLLALVAALFSEERAMRLKYIFAKQLDQVELMVSGGKDSILIHERNKRCVAVLDDSLAEGKKKLGIFYGAAHMPDIEKRLLERGFKLKSKTWLPAWTLTDKSVPSEKPGSKAEESGVKKV